MTLSKNEYQVLLIALGNQIFRDEKTAIAAESDEYIDLYDEDDKNNLDNSIRDQILIFNKIARNIDSFTPSYEAWKELNEKFLIC